MNQSVSIKLSESEKARLRGIAAARKVSVSSLIREGIERVLNDDDESSCYDLVSHLFEGEAGTGESGLGDLSTNKDRLAGIGQK